MYRYEIPEIKAPLEFSDAHFTNMWLGRPCSRGHCAFCDYVEERQAAYDASKYTKEKEEYYYE